MKIEKSNNPVAVGALVLVLVLIVGRILWMVFGHGGPAAAAATVPVGSLTPSAPTATVTEAAPAAAAAPAPEAVGEGRAVMPITTRNPFSVATRSAPAARRPDRLPDHEAAPGLATGAVVSPLMPLPVFPVRLAPGAGVKQPPAPHGPVALPTRPSAAQVPADALPALKLTATVGGTEPLAVVQTTDPEPVILHVGDTLDGMRVVAIHEQEVVFERGGGFWTLPLQSAQTAAAQTAADGGAAGAAPAAAPGTAPQPVVSVASPEEKTDGLE